MSDIVDNVKDLAYIGHDGQYRRGPGHTPYIEHPKAVVQTLQRWGIHDDATLAAAWAHDLLEDTDITEEEIVNAGGKLGNEIVSYVLDLTYYPSEWKDKREWLKHIARHCSCAVMYIKAADRYCNTLDFYKAGKVEKARDYLEDAILLVTQICIMNKHAREDFEVLEKLIGSNP